MINCTERSTAILPEFPKPHPSSTIWVGSLMVVGDIEVITGVNVSLKRNVKSTGTTSTPEEINLNNCLIHTLVYSLARLIYYDNRR